MWRALISHCSDVTITSPGQHRQILARGPDQRHVSRVPHSVPQTEDRAEKWYFCPDQCRALGWGNCYFVARLGTGRLNSNWIKEKKKTDCLQTSRVVFVLVDDKTECLRVIRSDQVWIIDSDTSEMLLPPDHRRQQHNIIPDPGMIWIQIGREGVFIAGDKSMKSVGAAAS